MIGVHISILTILFTLCILCTATLSPDMQRYYDTLGATEDDTLDIIKVKHRKLALQYHPDKYHSTEYNSDHNRSIKMQQINDAFDKVTMHIKSPDPEPSIACKDLLITIFQLWESIPEANRTILAEKWDLFRKSASPVNDVIILASKILSKQQIEEIGGFVSFALYIAIGVFALSCVGIVALVVFFVWIIYRLVRLIWWLLSSAIKFVWWILSSFVRLILRIFQPIRLHAD